MIDNLDEALADLPGALSERELEELRLRMDMVLDSMTEGVFGLDLDGRITFINNAGRALLGYLPEQLIGSRPEELLRRGNEDGQPYERPSPFKLAIEENRRQRVADEAFWTRRDTALPVEYTCTPLLLAGASVGALVVFSDVSERRAAQEKLEHMAKFDGLTELANRVLFSELLKSAVVRARRHQGKVALLFCDLDQFKAVNDTYGHEAGDEVLIETALRIKRAIRESDSPCRLAGDEFAVVLEDVTTEDVATAVAERLVAELNKPFHVAGRDLSVGGSVGVAIYPDHAADTRPLLHAADQAMYLAKRAGRGRWALASDELDA